MEHARNQKIIAALARQRLSAVPLHVLQQIDSHNERFVVRRADRIVVSRAPVKVRGKGQWRKWMPRAILRVCFGRGWCRSRRRIKCKQAYKSAPLRNKRRNPRASSLRAVADFFEGSVTHTQKVRNCFALGYSEAQRKFILSLPPAKHIVLLISFDESDTSIEIDGDKGTFSLLMMHVTMVWCERDSDREHIL